MNFYCTGDCHNHFERFDNFYETITTPVGMICLGDFGVNYYLNKQDKKNKDELYSKYPLVTFYCVRGNHEARPQDVKGMEEIYDENVHGMIYYEPQYPNIKYFKDFGVYQISRYKVGVIGGAYSVDKEYRLLNGWQWFPNEQLSYLEQDQCYNLLANKTYDFIFSHTCPYSWRPTDLFLNGINQNKVDTTMEEFLEKLIKHTKQTVYCFGHYHADRIERPGVQQFFHTIEDLDQIYERWVRYQNTGILENNLILGPNFFMDNSI